jgi:hypothetical protein
LFAAERSAADAVSQLPDPAFLYWKALEEERQIARRKALRPIILVERLSLLLVAGGAAVAFAKFAPTINWNGLDTVVEAPSIGPVTAAILLGISVVLCVGWLVWAEE